MKTQRIVVAGRYELSLRGLSHLTAHPAVEVVCVFATPEPAKPWQPSLAAEAERLGIPCVQERLSESLGRLRSLEPDLLFSLQYPWILSPDVLAVPSRGSFNLHFGRLPEFRGCFPIPWAILQGEEYVGVTLHLMTSEIDAGDVVRIAEVPITEDDNARTLYDAATAAGATLFAEELNGILRNEFPRTAQEPARASYFRGDSLDFRRDRWVRWDRPARDVHRQFQVFTFEPLQLPAVRLGDRTAEAWRSRLLPGEGGGEAPGTVLGTVANALKVAVSDGALAIGRFRLADGSEQTGADLLASGAVCVGQILPSDSQPVAG